MSDEPIRNIAARLTLKEWVVSSPGIVLVVAGAIVIDRSLFYGSLILIAGAVAMVGAAVYLMRKPKEAAP